ncbi:DUF402 domain-containing protein [Clostridium intestinale]|uniref:DUF402 domain-containing protein n=1 Tax=Clostridium intestinale TaxID=36845 RepID=UPI0028E3934B|nr:DUF402 domain-containing protein [Clostridium intestinale]
MKKKRLIYDEWTGITSKRYTQLKIDNEVFKGVAAMLYIDKVSKPCIWDFNGEEIIVCDSGMKWLQMLPDDGAYIITAMINMKNEIELWYIDIIASHGVDEDNIVYFYDLYLDLIVYPNGTIKIDDMDELVDAFEQNIITKNLYEFALKTSVSLQNGILKDIPQLKKAVFKLHK